MKRFRRNNIYTRLCLFFSVFVWSTSLFAQEVTDTSYFKQGNDNYKLIEAVIRNDALIVQTLLDRGANPNAVSSINNTPLIYAAESGNLEIMELLISRGANINSPGYRNETALFICIFRNDFEATKYLLENKADPNIRNDLGLTPLLYAAAANQYQNADLLLFFDANEKIKDKDGNDPLLTAVTFENIETSDVLLQNGLSPDIQDIHGNTPAIVATQRSNKDILELLLEYKADVNIANHDNYTPLAYAVTYNNYQAAELLIRNNADVNHQISPGKNILELADKSSNDSLITLLNESGAKVLKRPDFSELQLSWANSFNFDDYFFQIRASLIDKKYGFYLQTGLDYRPTLIKINTSINDTLYQFRERRIGWSHGAGRNFKLFESTDGISYSVYAAANGYLSFPSYLGSNLAPKIQYNIIPSVGALIYGQYLGVKAGVEWYKFGTMQESSLKVNLSVFVRFISPENSYDRKEIYWE